MAIPNLAPWDKRDGLSGAAWRTVPEPSTSGWRRGSARMAKIVSGGAGITRSTVTMRSDAGLGVVLTGPSLALAVRQDDRCGRSLLGA